ncbi:hypothetical protein D9M72_592830 [compost metagenome]
MFFELRTIKCGFTGRARSSLIVNVPSSLSMKTALTLKKLSFSRLPSRLLLMAMHTLRPLALASTMCLSNSVVNRP